MAFTQQPNGGCYSGSYHDPGMAFGELKQEADDA